MSYKCPGNAEYAWKSFQMSGGKFRKFAVKAFWQVVADFAKLFVDDVKIIYQPVGGGSDRVLLLNGSSRWTGNIREARGRFHARGE